MARKTARKSAARRGKPQGSNQSSNRSSTQSRKSSGSIDAIALLKADHSAVQKLFKEFEKADDDDRKQELATTICKELTVHTTIEEEIFYPAAREALEEGDLLDEAEVEHASAKELIAQIESGSAGDEKWDAKVCVLGEYINHHVKEEQDELFPKVKKSELDLQALGEQLRMRKEELSAEQPPSRGRMRANGGRAIHLNA